MTDHSDQLDVPGVRWGSVEWTNLSNLYLRAHGSHLKESVLGDRAPTEAVDRIDYDFARMRPSVHPWGNQFLVALRARQLDTWAADFLRRNPDAVVLHLGCGLDHRPFRLDVPSGVSWFDVDMPEVIRLRRLLYTERPGYAMIESSVTEPGWLDEIPADRPALIVAEGLLMYLTETEVRDLLRRLTDRFGTGELLADLLSPWGPRVSNSLTLAKSPTAGMIKWATENGRELLGWIPRLDLVETSMFIDPAKIPLRPRQLIHRMLTAIPVVKNCSRLYRFRF